MILKITYKLVKLMRGKKKNTINLYIYFISTVQDKTCLQTHIKKSQFSTYPAPSTTTNFTIFSIL